MQKQIQQTGTYQSQRYFTASEVAEFEYCPLAWWHEQFEPLVRADSDELFAELVAMEHEHGAQAPGLPEYQVIEQLLLRQGAFEEGTEQHEEHAAAVAELEEERVIVPGGTTRTRVLLWVALCLVILGLLMVAGSFFLSIL